MYFKPILILSLLLFTKSIFTYSQQPLTDVSAMEDCGILKSGTEGIKKPQDMLQRNCTECHTSVISYYDKFDLQGIDTLKPGEKFTHTWLTYTREESSKGIHISASGINVNNDTMPVKNALVLAVVQRYFGWMLVNPKPLFTDESGNLSFIIPDNIKGDSTGRFKLLIKLADERRYPNGKLKINLYWGESLNQITYSDSGRITAVIEPPYRWLSVTSILISVTTCILIGYIFYLIYKIKKGGREV